MFEVLACISVGWIGSDIAVSLTSELNSMRAEKVPNFIVAVNCLTGAFMGCCLGSALFRKFINWCNSIK